MLFQSAIHQRFPGKQNPDPRKPIRDGLGCARAIRAAFVLKGGVGLAVYAIWHFRHLIRRFTSSTKSQDGRRMYPQRAHRPLKLLLQRLSCEVIKCVRQHSRIAITETPHMVQPRSPREIQNVAVVHIRRFHGLQRHADQPGNTAGRNQS